MGKWMCPQMHIIRYVGVLTQELAADDGDIRGELSSAGAGGRRGGQG